MPLTLPLSERGVAPPPAEVAIQQPHPISNFWTPVKFKARSKAWICHRFEGVGYALWIGGGGGSMPFSFLCLLNAGVIVVDPMHWGGGQRGSLQNGPTANTKTCLRRFLDGYVTQTQGILNASMGQIFIR